MGISNLLQGCFNKTDTVMLYINIDFVTILSKRPEKDISNVVVQCR